MNSFIILFFCVVVSATMSGTNGKDIKPGYILDEPIESSADSIASTVAKNLREQSYEQQKEEPGEAELAHMIMSIAKPVTLGYPSKMSVKIQAKNHIQVGSTGGDPTFDHFNTTELKGLYSELEAEAKKSNSSRKLQSDTCNVGTRLTNTWGWNKALATVKIYMCWGSSCGYCSGSMIGEYQVLTSAHCVHDATQGWASTAFVLPGQTDNVWPQLNNQYGTSSTYAAFLDIPYGIAWAKHFYSNTGWTHASQSEQSSCSKIDYDFAVIELDRRIGRKVGWYGYSTGTPPSSLTLQGYPATTCTGLWQYRRSVTRASLSSDQFTIAGYIEGGDSGGPAYYNSGTQVGIASCSDSHVGGNTGWYTRISGWKFDMIQGWKASPNHNPQSRPQLVEYTDTSGRKGVSPFIVNKGGTLGVTTTLLNAGFASTGTIYLNYYLSSDAVRSGDIHIGSSTTSSLSQHTYRLVKRYLQVPEYTSSGYKYVLVTFSTANSQYDQHLYYIAAGTVYVSSYSPSSKDEGNVTEAPTLNETANHTYPPLSNQSETPVPTIPRNNEEGCGSCPSNSSPTRDCVKKFSHCKCNQGYHELKDEGICISNSECFEYVGELCRTSEGNSPRGRYKAVCTTEKSCSKTECMEKCFNSNRCRGFEYSTRNREDGVVCELHRTSIDYSTGDPGNYSNLDFCYRKTC